MAEPRPYCGHPPDQLLKLMPVQRALEATASDRLKAQIRSGHLRAFDKPLPP